MNGDYYFDENIKIDILTVDKIDEVMNFQEKVINNMDNKDYFCPLTREEFLKPILGRDNVYVLKDKNEIIGLFVLTCDVDNILMDYQLEKLDNLMLIDSIMIKENYRGRGFQRRILKYAEFRARQLMLDGLVATIHPDNKYSLNNFLIENYKIVNKLFLHGGWRYIVLKEALYN